MKNKKFESANFPIRGVGLPPSYSKGDMAEVRLQTEKRKWFVGLLRRANMLKATYRGSTQQTLY